MDFSWSTVFFLMRNYCRKKFSNRYLNQYCVNAWLWAKGCIEHLMLFRRRTWCLAPWVWNWPAGLAVGRDSLASRTHSKTHPTLQAPGYSGTQHHNQSIKSSHADILVYLKSNVWKFNHITLILVLFNERFHQVRRIGLTARAFPIASAPLLRSEFQLRSRSVMLSFPTFE